MKDKGGFFAYFRKALSTKRHFDRPHSSAAILVLVLLAKCACADMYVDGNGVAWQYVINNGEVTIGNGVACAIPRDTQCPVIIPSEIEGMPVTCIGEKAFGWCYDLSGITIPSSVRNIACQAFYGCRTLTEISIPDSVTNISSRAFGYCGGLTTVTVPAGVTSISADAFEDVGSVEYSGLAEGSPWGARSANGYVEYPLVFSDASKRCVVFCNSREATVIIPPSVKAIGDKAFSYCDHLQTLTIPNSVTNIGNEAFFYCDHLQSLTIPDSVTSIGNEAFFNCDHLQSLTIPDSVTSIGNDAFNGVRNIIYSGSAEGCPWGALSLNGYYEYPFVFSDSPKTTILSCDRTITSVTIPPSVTSIGDSAFEGCDGLTSVTIPSSVTNIGNRAFCGCQKLTSVTIPSSVTSIGARAFYYCRGLTSVTIPEGVTSIGDSAFASCSGLTSVTIPSSVTNIGEWAFSYCYKLTSVTVPDSVPNIGDFCFYYDRNVIYKGSSSGSPWGANCVNGYVEGPLVFTDNSKTTLVGCAGSANSVVIPNTVTSIGENAFIYCDLTSVTIPSSVTNIARGAFSYCGRLSSLTIPGSVTKIGDYAFSDCSGLSSLTLSEGVERIGNCAFTWNDNLISVTIPASVTTLGADAFAHFAALTSVTFEGQAPETESRPFTTIPEGCIAYVYPDSGFGAEGSFWYGLKVVYRFRPLPDGIYTNTVDGVAYAYEISAGKATIAHVEINEQTEVLIPENLGGHPVTSIGSFAFSGCGGLTSVKIPLCVTDIGDGAFEDCSHLKSLIVPASVMNIGGNSFSAGNYPVYFLGVPPEASSDVGGGFGVYLPQFKDAWECEISDEGIWNGMTMTASKPLSEDSVVELSDSYFVFCGKAIYPNVSVNLDRRELSENEYIVSYRNNEKPGIGYVSVTTDVRGVFETVEVAFTITDSLGMYAWSVSMTNDITWHAVADEDSPSGCAVRSPEIGSSAATEMSVAVSGEGLFAFDWRVSCNSRGHFLAVYADGVQQARVSGEKAWAHVAFDLGDGEHAVTWRYEKGSTTAAGEDAGFVDNVSWRPSVDVAAQTAHGTAAVSGTDGARHYGDVVTASVEAVVEEDGWRYGCAGWAGSGSIPASGPSNTVSFTLYEDSEITWLWETNCWVELSLTGPATTAFTNRWVKYGESVRIDFATDALFYEFAFTGDMAGVVREGDALVFVADRPRTISAVCTSWLPVENVTASSAHGTAVVSGTEGARHYGDVVTASVEAVVEEDGWRYGCTGWAGSGSIPASGPSNTVSFVLYEDSEITWLWETNCWVELSLTGPATTAFTNRWVKFGESVRIDFAPTTAFYTAEVSGDRTGVTRDGNSLSFVADRPRSLAVAVNAVTLGGVLDAPKLEWTTYGAAAWTPQLEIASDATGAAVSGPVLGDDVSCLETTVTGPGTLAYKAMVSTGHTAGFDLFIDGEFVDGLYDACGWTAMSTEITGEGEHVVRWEFWNAGTADDLADFVAIDCVSWSGEMPSESSETQTTPVPVPYEWLDEYGLGGTEAAYETAAMATAANGVDKVWQCYVAGLDPTDKDAVFRARIAFENGAPVVSWEPKLPPEEEAKRIYTIEGKAELGGTWSSPVEASHRFFHVKVEMK